MEGKGTPIILVHGWGGTAASLRPLAKLLSKNYTTILVDLPGFGKSDPPGPEWGVGEYSRNLVAFVNTLDVGNVIYLGHSFGGALGIHIAARSPHTIKKLVLLAPSYKRNKHRPTLKTQFLKRVFGHIPMAKMMYYKIFYPSSDLLKYPRLEANFRKILSQDLSEDTHKIGVPTLILWGATDKYVAPADAQALHENIKGSRLKIFEDKGHGLPLFHPEVVASEVVEFLGNSK